MKAHVLFLKQQLASHTAPTTIATVHSSTVPSFLRSIDDGTVRQRLFHRYERILQQTKLDLTVLLIQSAESKTRSYQQTFELAMADLWKQHRQTSVDQRFNQAMLDLIDQRLKNITERFQAIDHFLLHSFFWPAPTIQSMP